MLNGVGAFSIVADTDQQSPDYEPSAPAEESRSASVGGILKASRNRQGQSLPDVAQTLRIRRPYLEAIEEGRYDDLPGPAYAGGFVRAYAEHLGLDSDEVLRRFKLETSGQSGNGELYVFSPIPEYGVPKGAVILIGVLILLLGYGGWYVSTSETSIFGEEGVLPVPERLSTLLPETESPPPGEPTVEEVTEPQKPDAAPPAPKPAKPAKVESEGSPPEETQPEPQAAPEPQPEPVAEEPAPTPSEPAEEAEVAETTAPPPAPEAPAAEPDAAGEGQGEAFGQENADARVVLVARMDAWVQVRDTESNKILLSQLMRADDTYRVPNRPGLTLLTGNAGALDIMVDGTKAPSLGALGAVRRNVSLNPGSLLSGR